MILPSSSLSQPIFLAILKVSQYLFLLIIIIRLPFDFPVILNLPLLLITLVWKSLIFAATVWAFHSTTPLIHYRDNIGQFISKALQNYYGFGTLLVYTSFHLFVFVLYLGRARGVSCANKKSIRDDIDWCYHKYNEWSSVVAMCALPTAILSAVKLVATPTDASVVARFFMTHSLINALLLLRDGASRVALGTALFPLLPAIAIYLCTFSDTRVLPFQNTQIKQVSDCKEVHISISEEVARIKQVSECEKMASRAWHTGSKLKLITIERKILFEPIQPRVTKQPLWIKKGMRVIFKATMRYVRKRKVSNASRSGSGNTTTRNASGNSSKTTGNTRGPENGGGNVTTPEGGNGGANGGRNATRKKLHR